MRDWANRAVQRDATPGDVVLAVSLAAGMNAIVFTAVAYGTSFLRVLQAIACGSR
jgi:hypothetical protein